MSTCHARGLTVSLADLPGDLISDILLRLPVKSLLLCECVCKSWRSMIRGSRFVSEHLERSSRKGSPDGCFLIAKSTYGRVALLSSSLEIQREVGVSHLFGIARSSNRYVCFQIAGSCNGIVCLSSYSFAVLWNPARGHSRIICSSNLCTNGGLRKEKYHGFGYSSKIGDYKLLRMVFWRHYKNNNYGMSAEVFTLKENSWRKVPDPDYYPGYLLETSGGICVNETLNWVAPEVVLSFDLEKDVFKSISLSSVFEKGYNINTKLAARQQSLLLITYPREITLNRCVDIWMTDPQATQPIWTRLMRIDPPLVGLPHPLGLGFRGEIYIRYGLGDEVAVYESRSGTVPGEHFLVDYMSRSDPELYPYVESLVPLHNQS